MSNPIDASLGLRPMETIDNETGEIITMVSDEEIIPVVEEDPNVKAAQEDAQVVRRNLQELMEFGMDMLQDVATVAKQAQDADRYAAAARWFAETVKANKELMNVHRDIIAIKPPVPTAIQAPDVVHNNVFVSTTSEDLIRMLKEKGIGRLPSKE